MDRYKGEIEDVIRTHPELRSVYVHYGDITDVNAELAESLFMTPDTAISAGERVLKDKTNYDVHLRITGLPSAVARFGIRELRAEQLGKFISVDGLVKRATVVRPKLRVAVFQCVRCGAIIRIAQEETTLREPFECPKDQGGCGRGVNTTAFKLIRIAADVVGDKGPESSQFVDTQKLEIQESPEGLRGGAQPQSLVGYAEDDIAGQLAPGDRVILNGILQGTMRRERGLKSTVFDIFLLVNSIEIEEQEFEDIILTPEDEKWIRKLSKDKGLYEKITSSIAPSIFGLETEKEALALQLFGGVRKTMPDSTRIRGDVHILFVGDPGTAKSQLLRYMSNLAPRGIYASGKSASAAGLTAAAVKDDFGEGRWTLEAGALVLADKGLAAVDEIDKMSKGDRSAMHEAMEQQTVSVAKAGITATLQSRCALLSAANPKFGRFDENDPLADQIDMPPALLTRFDLIFTIADKPDVKNDTKMAEHILSMHEVGTAILHKKKTKKAAEANPLVPEIAPELLRKYIAYSKRNVVPMLTKEAHDTLRDYYVDLRRQGVGENLPVPITPRQLEAFIRLTEASARARLSKKITKEDAERSIRIMEYCLKKVAYEGGHLDIDLLTSGTSKPQWDRIKTVTEIIRELTERDPTGAHEEDIIEESQAHGLTMAEVSKTIERMKSKGDIFEPKRGTKRYKLVT